MDDRSAIQAAIDRQSGPLAKRIFETYMRTPEGRSKLAHSMIHPVRLLIEYISVRSRVTVDTLEYHTRIDDYKTFLAAVPNEERSREPYVELQGYVTDIEAFLKNPTA
jgi:hypothetical protein